MKKREYVLLSAILLAGGCGALERKAEIREYKRGLKDGMDALWNSFGEMYKNADEKGYKRGLKEGIEIASNAAVESFADAFRDHLLRDQLYLTNLQNACNNLASKYDSERNEKAAEFYRLAAMNARIELLKIERYFKNTK